MRMTAAVSLAVALGTIQTHGLSRNDIELAIQQGMAGKELKASCEAIGANGAARTSGYVVDLWGPAGRIADAAKRAHDANQPFTVDNVTASMRAPFVIAMARPLVPIDPITGRAASGTGASPVGYANSVYDIRLRTRKSGASAPVVLAPRTPASTSSQTVLPRLGGNTQLGPVAFDLEAFRALPAGDLDVLLMGFPQKGSDEKVEYSCKVSGKGRANVR